MSAWPYPTVSESTPEDNGPRRAHGPSRQARMPVAAITAVLVASLLGALPVAAADADPPQLVDVTLSTSAISVAGLDVETITVSVHLTDDVGVEPRFDMSFFPWPHVVLSRTDGKTGAWRLTLASGTPADGIWTGEVIVASTDDGLWRVSAVRAMDTSANELDIDPATVGIVRTLDVTGTHQPRLSFGFAPKPATPGQPIIAKGRLTYADTGQPIPGQVLLVGYDNSCADYDALGGRRIRTNTNGYYRFAVPLIEDSVFLSCVFLVRPLPVSPSGSFNSLDVGIIAARGGFPQMRVLVTARPSSHAVPLGSRIRIDGQVRPRIQNVRIYLQRWTADGWRVESYATIRASGRYTLFARPPRQGTFRYRVIRPSIPPGLVGGVSQVMRLTAR